MRIYLWGPSGTGKTWLFNAFVRKVNLIDDALIRASQPSFSIWLEDRLGARQYRYTLETQPTLDIDYQEYMFHREFLLGDNQDKRKLACNHSHEFIMMDGPGDETVGEIILSANTEENRAKVLAAHEALKDSDYLVICLGPGIRGISSNSSIGITDVQTPGKFYIAHLFRLMNLSRNSGQQVVICFTKSDIYGGRVAGFDAALNRSFGAYGHEIGMMLRELSGTRNEPPHFFVSSVGYLHNREGRVVPNINRQTNKLTEPENWNPEGAESPFFKIFTDAELRTLKNMTIDQPGFWGNLKSKFLVDDLRKELISVYIDYNKMILPAK